MLASKTTYVLVVLERINIMLAVKWSEGSQKKKRVSLSLRKNCERSRAERGSVCVCTEMKNIFFAKRKKIKNHDSKSCVLTLSPGKKERERERRSGKKSSLTLRHTLMKKSWVCAKFRSILRRSISSWCRKKSILALVPPQLRHVVSRVRPSVVATCFVPTFFLPFPTKTYVDMLNTLCSTVMAYRMAYSKKKKNIFLLLTTPLLLFPSKKKYIMQLFFLRLVFFFRKKNWVWKQSKQRSRKYCWAKKCNTLKVNMEQTSCNNRVWILKRNILANAHIVYFLHKIFFLSPSCLPSGFWGIALLHFSVGILRKNNLKK